MPMAVINGARRGALRRLVGDALHRHVDESAAEHRTASATRIAGRTDPKDELGEPELADQHRSHHRPEHEHVAVGEVDQLEDAVDEVAERHQRIQPAVQSPIRKTRNHCSGAWTRLTTSHAHTSPRA